MEDNKKGVVMSFEEYLEKQGGEPTGTAADTTTPEPTDTPAEPAPTDAPQADGQGGDDTDLMLLDEPSTAPAGGEPTAQAPKPVA